MNNKELRVLIFTCRQSGQRINYYNALGRQCHLTVVAERKTPNDILETYNVKPESYKVIYLHGIPMFGYMAFCPGVIAVLRRHREYDVIIIEQYSTPTALISINYLKRHNIPFVISADSGFVDESERRIKYNLKKSLISKASFWITGGKGSVSYLEHYGADPEKTRIFKFSPYSKNDQPDHKTTGEEKMETRDKLSITEEKIIVSVGQQIHRKGFDVLIRAMSSLKNGRGEIGLYILGGSPNDECQAILNEISMENIHFPGKVSKDTLKKYYMAADLFVFPTRYDIWGYPINEAMSFGLPVITTYQCSAGMELIEEGINGYLVEAEDVESLYKLISDLLNDDGLRTEMGDINYIKSKNYNSESMAESIYEIILEYHTEISKKG